MKLYYSFLYHPTESQESFQKRKYLYRILPNFLMEHGIMTSIKEMEVYFYIPNSNPKILDNQNDFLAKLPTIRFTQNRTKVFIGKLFLGKNGDAKPSIENILFEFSEVFQLLEHKKKVPDNFQTESILKLLPQLTQELHENLDFHNQKFAQIIRQEIIDRVKQDRQERQQNTNPAKRLIRDIRLYYNFENQAIERYKFFFPYSNQLCDKILNHLRARKFRLPNYDHLYIMVSENIDNALSHAIRGERWLVYGIAVLEKPLEYQCLTPKEKKKVVFNLIKQGLLDIAQVDNLDTNILNEVLNHLEQSL